MIDGGSVFLGVLLGGAISVVVLHFTRREAYDAYHARRRPGQAHSPRPAPNVGGGPGLRVDPGTKASAVQPPDDGRHWVTHKDGNGADYVDKDGKLLCRNRIGGGDTHKPAKEAPDPRRPPWLSDCALGLPVPGSVSCPRCGSTDRCINRPHRPPIQDT